VILVGIEKNSGNVQVDNHSELCSNLVLT